MTTTWETRGRIDHTSIGQIAISPTYASNPLVVAVSPAGLHVSHDGGKHWDAPARGVVGPFLRDIAVGTGGAILATSPTGLLVSHDRGETWSKSSTPEFIGAITTNGDDGFVVASETDGRIWRGDLATGVLRSWAALPEPATQLFTGADRVLALVGESIFSTCDGSSWHRVSLSYRGDIESCAMSRDGSVIAITTDRGVMLSTDGGQSWTERQLDQSVLSVAITPDSSRLFVGVVGDGILCSDDLGGIWSAYVMSGGAIVVNLTSGPDGLHAELVEGQTLQSCDLRTWRIAPPKQRDNEALLRECRDELSLSEDEEIVNSVIADDDSVAVATTRSDGECSVYLRVHGIGWRRIIAHPETARTVKLVMRTGPKDLFAAIGDSVYRPAKLGVALWTREVLDLDLRSEILALTATVDCDGESMLAALTNSAISRSTDRGINWTPVPRPEGPPITAIAWLSTQAGPELVATHLGGMISALPRETLRRGYDDKRERTRR